VRCCRTLLAFACPGVHFFASRLAPVPRHLHLFLGSCCSAPSCLDCFSLPRDSPFFCWVVFVSTLCLRGGPKYVGVGFCLGASYLKCKSLWVSDRLMLECSLVSTFVSWKGSWAAKLWHRRASGATQFGSRLFCAPQYVCIAHPGSYVSLWMQQSSAM